jgi:hypothetical protein
VEMSIAAASSSAVASPRRLRTASTRRWVGDSSFAWFPWIATAVARIFWFHNMKLSHPR